MSTQGSTKGEHLPQHQQTDDGLQGSGKDGVVTLEKKDDGSDSRERTDRRSNGGANNRSLDCCQNEAAPTARDIARVEGDESQFPLLDGSGDCVDALPEDKSYSCLDLLCTLISVATYVFDLSMDVIVAVYFYHLAASHGIYHYWYVLLHRY